MVIHIMALPQAGYPGYSLGPQIVDENHDSFAGSGGQLVGKVDFLRSVMSKFGVSKPIMMTEIGLHVQGSRMNVIPLAPLS